ncbi:MAG: hypothetical protein M3173_04805, partial [Chloroflexota bacterium]|nr:hypothetical protein [Chloroflexota bacterium]
MDQVEDNLLDATPVDQHVRQRLRQVIIQREMGAIHLLTQALASSMQHLSSRRRLTLQWGAPCLQPSQIHEILDERRQTVNLANDPLEELLLQL